MSATTIMVIRHGEKPTDEIHGVDQHGEHDHDSLSVRGWQRAGALTGLFRPNQGLVKQPLPIPERIFATASDKANKSTRPQHTVRPLAERLGLVINTQFDDKDIEAVAGAAINSNKLAVLICWHHEQIPNLAHAILGKGAVYPKKWPDERFDVIWVFDWDEQQKKYELRQVPMELLAGDVASLIQ